MGWKNGLEVFGFVQASKQGRPGSWVKESLSRMGNKRRGGRARVGGWVGYVCMYVGIKSPLLLPCLVLHVHTHTHTHTHMHTYTPSLSLPLPVSRAQKKKGEGGNLNHAPGKLEFYKKISG
ncbi:hypothetical protein DM02DRAFT_408911 [Periconia macrospinosa]|uniref:Uncharacterized protein n=1 Tax=Periconia macrospinosa TaxID=97972 RepID=A0A2V1EBR7_9PLEO|nr:hypothetical protein DM02DRAFT_408911 [Periconia macrospinosa]